MEAVQKYFLAWAIVLAVILMISALAVAPLYLRRKSLKEPAFLLRNALLSPAEQIFFSSLQEAVAGRWWVFPKVRVEDILEISSSLDRPDGQGARTPVSPRPVDFVICEPLSYRFLAAIQFDGIPQNTAGQEHGALMDEVMALAGLPILHFPLRSAYSSGELRLELERVLGTSG